MENWPLARRKAALQQRARISGNIHPGKVSMFEPIHGSAPKHAGKGVICPMAALPATQMMLDFLGHERSAARLDTAITKALTCGEIKSIATSSGMKTSEYTDVVLKHLNATGRFCLTAAGRGS